MSEPFNDVVDTVEEIQLQENCTESPGACLTTRRQALGWSIEQVADQIKLSPHQILAIESDDYAGLPMVVARGFIRSYAKCLTMDVMPLLAMLKSEDIPNLDEPLLRRAIPVKFSESRFPLNGKKSGITSKWGMGVILLILLLLTALLAQKKGWLPDLSKVNIVSSINREVLMPSEVITLPMIKVTKPASQINEDDPAVTSVLTAPPIDASQKEVVVPAGPIAATEKNQLVLQAHADSWIEIKRADKSIAVSRILKAGEVERFEISEPVLLTIGNVAGVNVTLRGASFNAKAGVTGNVARINVK
ncbi:MAG: helix-turn-helix domain-containing protein [Burkholderiaceae bacterium]